MAKKRDKDGNRIDFGTPYDPRVGGKITRPKEPEKSSEDQRQTRGCGDPNCSMCNPETATRNVSRRTPPAFGLDVRGPNGWDRTLGEEIRRDILERMVGGRLTGEELRGIMGSPGAVSEPEPASLKKARKAVEQYIVDVPEQAFDDIIGNEDALGQLRDAVRAPVDHKELYEAYGMVAPKGAVLSGPPGCGKTMFGRAVASEMRQMYGDGTEFLSLSGSELQTMYVGETEARITALFTYAREYKKHHGHPLLIFIDEAEVILPDRTGRVRRVAPWEESQVATFLAEMDGVKENGAFVLLATNRPEVIDQAVLRDGRCDFKVVVKRPTSEALEIILRKNFQSVPALSATAEELVFAALEGLMDPHKVILHAQAIEARSDGQLSLKGKAFTLGSIVSGAMAASLPARAKRFAFARDKDGGTVSGVTVEDVLSATTALFEENKNLDHTFALREFVEEFAEEVREVHSAEKRKGMN